MQLTRVEHRDLLRALRSETTIPPELQDRAAQHIAECPKCRRALNEAEQLRQKLKPALNPVHPSSENLLAYLTGDSFEASTQTKTEGSFTRHEEVHAHLQSCTFCQNRAEHLRGEITQIRSIMKNVRAELTFEHDYQTTQSAAIFGHPPQKKRFGLLPMSKMIMPTAAASAALLVLFFLSFATQSEIYPLAHLNADKLNVFKTYRTAVENDDLQLLIVENAINNAQYNNAKQTLTKLDPTELSSEQTLRFGLYDFMLRLKDAHRSYFSFFKHFEKSEVRAALQPMEQILAKLETPFPGSEVDWCLAHYYCAKAYLMLEESAPAVTHLEKALLIEHQRRPQAEELLRVLKTK